MERLGEPITITQTSGTHSASPAAIKFHDEALQGRAYRATGWTTTWRRACICSRVSATTQGSLASHEVPLQTRFDTMQG